MQKEEREVEEKTFLGLLANNKLEDIMQIIDSVANGKITKNKNICINWLENPLKKLMLRHCQPV